jgi:hypothetical protein
MDHLSEKVADRTNQEKQAEERLAEMPDCAMMEPWDAMAILEKEAAPIPPWNPAQRFSDGPIQSLISYLKQAYTLTPTRAVLRYQGMDIPTREEGFGPHVQLMSEYLTAIGRTPLEQIFYIATDVGRAWYIDTELPEEKKDAVRTVWYALAQMAENIIQSPPPNKPTPEQKELLRRRLREFLAQREMEPPQAAKSEEDMSKEDDARLLERVEKALVLPKKEAVAAILRAFSSWMIARKF